jgi:hypothetical protein
MKAVCTTLGWFAAAAAPTAGAELPLGDVFPMSPLARPCSGALPRSAGGQFMVGGPMEDVDEGVMSMGSRGGASVEPDEGRMGIDLCRLELCGSGEKGLRRASATDAIMAAWGQEVVVDSSRGRRALRRRWGQPLASVSGGGAVAACALARPVCNRCAVESPQGLGAGDRSDGAERLRRSMRYVWPRARRGRRGRAGDGTAKNCF